MLLLLILISCSAVSSLSSFSAHSISFTIRLAFPAVRGSAWKGVRGFREEDFGAFEYDLCMTTAVETLKAVQSSL